MKEDIDLDEKHFHLGTEIGLDGFCTGTLINISESKTNYKTVRSFNPKWLFNLLWIFLIYSSIALGVIFIFNYCDTSNIILTLSFSYFGFQGVRLSTLFMFDPLESFWNYKYIKLK